MVAAVKAPGFLFTQFTKENLKKNIKQNQKILKHQLNRVGELLLNVIINEKKKRKLKNHEWNIEKEK